MSDTTPRVDPTLSALPPALKKRIIKALEEIDADSHGDCESCCGTDDEEGDHDHSHDHSHKHKGALGDFKEVEAELDELAAPVEAMLKNVGNLALVNKEFWKLCSPFIWQVRQNFSRKIRSFSVARFADSLGCLAYSLQISSSEVPNRYSTSTTIFSLVTPNISNHYS